MAEDLTGGKGRKDEVGRSGIYPATGPYPKGKTPVITPADINSNAHAEPSRRERLGIEDDEPDSDALGG